MTRPHPTGAATVPSPAHPHRQTSRNAAHDAAYDDDFSNTPSPTVAFVYSGEMPSTLPLASVIVLIVAVAAIITPPDPGSQLLLAIPLLLLFEGSLLLMRLTEKRRKAEDEQAEETQSAS